MKEIDDAVQAASHAFRKMGWVWEHPVEHVPSEREIREQLCKYLLEVHEAGHSDMECGRLMVRRVFDGAGLGLYLNLGTVWERDMAQVLEAQEGVGDG